MSITGRTQQKNPLVNGTTQKPLGNAVGMGVQSLCAALHGVSRAFIQTTHKIKNFVWIRAFKLNQKCRFSDSSSPTEITQPSRRFFAVQKFMSLFQRRNSANCLNHRHLKSSVFQAHTRNTEEQFSFKPSLHKENASRRKKNSTHEQRLSGIPSNENRHAAQALSGFTACW
jgi:hypothetical protein